MNEFDAATSRNDDTIDEINLRPFIRANESWFRNLVSTLVFEELHRAIGKENRDQITVTFRGSLFDDMLMYIEGPADLRARIVEAFRSSVMSEFDRTASPTSDAHGEIDLRPLIRANESGIRYYIGTVIRERMIQAIGRENLEKVALYSSGSPLDDLTVFVEGPADLKAKVEEALRKP